MDQGFIRSMKWCMKVLLFLLSHVTYAQHGAPCDAHDHTTDPLSHTDSVMLAGLVIPAREAISILKDDPLHTRELRHLLKAFHSRYAEIKVQASDNRLLHALFPSEVYDRVIELSNRDRNIPLSLHYIEESRTVHPWGPYGALHNCKHQ
jgi:hypothetical protein